MPKKGGRARDDLIDNLHHGVFCRLRPSPVHGVGVFAIREIPRGVNPFAQASPEVERSVGLSAAEFSRLPEPVREYLTDFFARDGDSVPVFSRGPNAMDPSFYLNHSDSPNLDQVAGAGDYLEFRTNRRVAAGEELFIDYRAGPWERPA
ncbi:MAG: SET domain-containing protein-lysine N-methyltransferase [Sulfobacillus sp.]